MPANHNRLGGLVGESAMTSDMSAISNGSSISYTASSQRDSPFLRALLSAGLGVSLASLYYAYRRYQNYRAQQQVQNLTWHIRLCTVDDLDAVTDQTFSAFDDLVRAHNRAGTSPVNRDYWLKVIGDLLNHPKPRGLLAVDDSTGAIIGSVFGDESDDDIVTLGPFSVLTKYADHGIARKLVQQLIDECLQSNPRRRMIMTQSPQNAKTLCTLQSIGLPGTLLLDAHDWLCQVRSYSCTE